MVPPMSTTTDVSPSGLRARAPIMLAAGPEEIVSTGNSIDFSIGRAPPSALRIYTGALIFLSSRAVITS